jgi:hypothetical protein
MKRYEENEEGGARMKRQFFPIARQKGLVVEDLKDETLVYDVERHKAHCLDRAAALIWRECDGKTSVDEIASRVHGKSHLPVDSDVVWMAVKRLGRAHLFRERIVPPADLMRGKARRDVMKKLALVGGLSVLSILVPTASQAASQCVSCKHSFKNGKPEVGQPCCNKPGKCIRVDAYNPVCG